MESVFLRILNMSVSALWLILAVVILRALLKRAPKSAVCVLWALVAIRLACPVSPESVLSLVPSAQTVPQDIIYAERPVIYSGIPAVNQMINPVISQSLAPEVGASANPVQIIIFILCAVWAAGAAAMLVYAAVSRIMLGRRVRESVRLRENIRSCDSIGTPFVLGVIRPRIYVPSSIDEADIEHVAAHENAHIARLDHLWKPLGFALLSVHWFNPLVWLAYILFCRDLELACDERVIRKMDIAGKKAYSQSLLKCSLPGKIASACPLAFCEVGVKERIKSVLSYKKPAFFITAVSAAVCIILAVCFLTNPPPAGNDVLGNTGDYAGVGGADGPETVYLRYKCESSPEPIAPVILLSQNDQTFQLVYSALSSVITGGKYEIAGDNLILRDDVGQNIYVFKIQGDAYVFDAESSSPLPEYRYSGDSDEASPPFEDGARFVPGEG